jgi:hypothetical protein
MMYQYMFNFLLCRTAGMHHACRGACDRGDCAAHQAPRGGAEEAQGPVQPQHRHVRNQSLRWAITKVHIQTFKFIIAIVGNVPPIKRLEAELKKRKDRSNLSTGM